jgi:hypothetical protein
LRSTLIARFNDCRLCLSNRFNSLFVERQLPTVASRTPRRSRARGSIDVLNMNRLSVAARVVVHVNWSYRGCGLASDQLGSDQDDLPLLPSPKGEDRAASCRPPSGLDPRSSLRSRRRRALCAVQAIGHYRSASVSRQ